jgi:hypothetical protein
MRTAAEIISRNTQQHSLTQSSFNRPTMMMEDGESDPDLQLRIPGGTQRREQSKADSKKHSRTNTISHGSHIETIPEDEPNPHMIEIVSKLKSILTKKVKYPLSLSETG